MSNRLPLEIKKQIVSSAIFNLYLRGLASVTRRKDIKPNNYYCRWRITTPKGEEFIFKTIGEALRGLEIPNNGATRKAATDYQLGRAVDPRGYKWERIEISQIQAEAEENSDEEGD